MIGFNIRHSNQDYESSNDRLYDESIELFEEISIHNFICQKRYVAQYHLLRD
ncbi:hypothetical protein N480_23810 [Pseudoalteromonas luteoviolacea S2607]|nr:hypothetical protein N480_23810 [Pseudoalteromonas luteoviolacea S2607]